MTYYSTPPLPTLQDGPTRTRLKGANDNWNPAVTPLFLAKRYKPVPAPIRWVPGQSPELEVLAAGLTGMKRKRAFQLIVTLARAQRARLDDVTIQAAFNFACETYAKRWEVPVTAIADRALVAQRCGAGTVKPPRRPRGMPRARGSRRAANADLRP